MAYEGEFSLGLGQLLDSLLPRSDAGRTQEVTPERSGIKSAANFSEQRSQTI